MKTLLPLVGFLLVVGFVIQYFWWLLGIGAVAGLIYVVWRQMSKAQQVDDGRAATQLSRALGKTPAAHPPSQLQFRTVQRTPQRPRTRTVRPTSAAPIRRAFLTRAVTGVDMEGVVFTAVDLETTGLDATVDRIVEIGLVKFRADGEILDEFATLVNSPGSSREAREHHQIQDTDLTGAPMIDQVLPEVLEFVSGTVLVAHNLDFEEGFLASAARRCGIQLPLLTGLNCLSRPGAPASAELNSDRYIATPGIRHSATTQKGTGARSHRPAGVKCGF